MAYQPINSLSELGQMSRVPVGLTLDALQTINRGGAADENNLAAMMQQNEHQSRMYPMQEQQQQLANDTSLAQLPGIQANSSMLQRKNSNEGIFNDSHIQDILGKYKADEIQRHVQSMDALGTSAQQAAELVAKNPLGGAAIAKDLFKRSGHADMWNPEWDNMSPGQLAMTLDEAGKAIQSAGTKFNQALSTQQIKAEAAMRLEASREAARQALQDSRLSALREMQQLTLSFKQKLDKPNLEQLAARAMLHAQQADADGDTALAAKFRKQGEEAQKAAESIKAAGAVATTDVKPALGPMGIPTNKDVRDKAASQHSLSQLKQMYPGKTDDELKTAYKAKFGVEPN